MISSHLLPIFVWFFYVSALVSSVYPIIERTVALNDVFFLISFNKLYEL
jgi:hypothetical protein